MSKKFKIENKNDIEVMKKMLDEGNLVTYTPDSLRRMNKKELIRIIISLTANRQILRDRNVELKLENNFLNRKVVLLEQQIRFLTPHGKRNFKNLKCYRNLAREIQEERFEDGDKNGRTGE